MSAPPRPLRTRPAVEPSLLALTLVVAALLLATAPAARADASSSLPLTGSVSGPSTVGTALNASYLVQATGGPALAPNGTQTGIYSFKATLAGANTTAAGAAIVPSTGVLTGGEINLTLKAPKVVELITLYVLVTSSQGATNVSQNFSYAVNIVQPYVVSANLVVGSAASVSPFYLTVLLDGAPVGAVHVPGLSAGSSYPVAFSYVPMGLAAGWHTFSVSLASEHGLVTFAGGADVYSVNFYVNGPATNNTLWYVTGITAFVGVIFIWSTRVSARRRGRSKK